MCEPWPHTWWCECEDFQWAVPMRMWGSLMGNGDDDNELTIMEIGFWFEFIWKFQLWLMSATFSILVQIMPLWPSDHCCAIDFAFRSFCPHNPNLVGEDGRGWSFLGSVWMFLFLLLFSNFIFIHLIVKC